MQILDSLVILRRAGIIHCDLKPENVLLVNGTSAACRVIDFGSACFEGRTVYSYIQSRFYRSPEVILGHPYNSLVDVWSLGCIAAELFLGLPLFPGSSDYDMLHRIEMYIGPALGDFLARSSLAHRSYIEEISPVSGARLLRLMTLEEYTACHNGPPSIGKQYFKHLHHLPEHEINLECVIMQYPTSEGSPCEIEAEQARRQCFLDFVRGMLVIDPLLRWTPWQALQHPFMTGLPFTGPFVPLPEPMAALSPLQSSSIPHVVPRCKAHRYTPTMTPATPSPAASSMHFTASTPFVGGSSVGACPGAENLLSMSASSRGGCGLTGPSLDTEMMATIPPPNTSFSLGSSLGTVSMGQTFGSSVSHQSAAVLAMQVRA
jgi:serine/threonine protein kinase